MPDAHVVCGVELKPFCIGHWLNLNRCGVSFVNTAAEFHMLEDLLTAVLVCSETYEGFARSLRSGGVGRSIYRWQRRLSGGYFGALGRKWRTWRGKLIEPREIIGFDFSEQCVAFQSYLNEHGYGTPVNDWAIPLSLPTNPDKQARSLSSPPLMVLVDALISELNLALSDALNLPLPFVRWMWAVHAERKGWCSVVGEMDMAEAKENQKLADDFARKLQAGEIAMN